MNEIKQKFDAPVAPTDIIERAPVMGTERKLTSSRVKEVCPHRVESARVLASRQLTQDTPS